MSVVIKVENLGKRYRLGAINRHLLYEELQSWWARVRGKEDPNSPLRPKRTQVGTGNFWALRNINFEVNKGDVVGIIGKNGSGKSTLLKILSEITTPTNGRALMNGTVSSLLEVGTGFHAELTGRENVYLNGSILGMDKDEIDRKYEEIVEFSGVREFMDTPVKRYSSGMKLRLAFAVAAHLEPDILILDEVLAVGDANFQQKCLGRVSEVARDGRTILFVSHNMAAIQSLCTRGIVLNDGEISFIGTADEAVAHYMHELNAVAISLRERTDRKGSGDIRFVGIELRDKNGRALSTIRSGDDVDIYFFLENKTGRSFSDLRFRIQVKNQFDVPTFVHWNNFRTESLGTMGGTAVAVCRLQKLPLCESFYRIDCRVSAPGHDFDRIENALEFFVEGSDYFGGLELTQHGRAACAVRGEWELKESVPPAKSLADTLNA